MAVCRRAAWMYGGVPPHADHTAGRDGESRAVADDASAPIGVDRRRRAPGSGCPRPGGARQPALLPAQVDGRRGWCDGAQRQRPGRASRRPRWVRDRRSASGGTETHEASAAGGHRLMDSVTGASPRPGLARYRIDLSAAGHWCGRCRVHVPAWSRYVPVGRRGATGRVLVQLPARSASAVGLVPGRRPGQQPARCAGGIPLQVDHCGLVCPGDQTGAGWTGR